MSRVQRNPEIACFSLLMFQTDPGSLLNKLQQSAPDSYTSSFQASERNPGRLRKAGDCQRRRHPGALLSV
ncbi:MAG: hypothetical protein JWO48_2487 [Bryobacterales bacterium]|nr:hypothetical protein [Bryobacterales bacterium]